MLIPMILELLARDFEGRATLLDPFCRLPSIHGNEPSYIPNTFSLRNNPCLSQHPRGKSGNGGNPLTASRIERWARFYQNRDTLKGEMVVRLARLTFSREPREIPHGLDLRAPRLGSCSVFLRRFRSISLFWRVMSRVIAGTKRRGTTMTV